MTSPSHTANLCNETIINKMGLSSTIFVLGLEEVICVVRFCSLVRGFQFINLVLPLDLCAWMLGRLGTKVREASRNESRSLGWLGAKILRVPYFH